MKTEALRGILADQWMEPLKGFIESEQFDSIINVLKREKSLGYRIQPATDKVFRALNLTHPDNIKVIMAAQDPYNSLTKDNEHIADGLAFSCGLTHHPQPSLKNIHQGIVKTHGESKMVDKGWDLEYLAAQGVLLINSSLTVRSYSPNSHKGVWDKFLDEIFYEIINKVEHPLVYILLGKEAVNHFTKYIRIGDHVLTAVHPAAASYSGGIWDCNDVFNKCNKLLRSSNLTPINW